MVPTAVLASSASSQRQEAMKLQKISAHLYPKRVDNKTDVLQLEKKALTKSKSL